MLDTSASPGKKTLPAPVQSPSETVFGWEPLDQWPHQAAAVHTVREYLRAHKRGEIRDNKTALIQMPTGTGKTGIAAILGMCFRDLPVVLVITPRVALRTQMARDIRHKFWKHITIDPKSFNKKVSELLPKKAQHLLDTMDHHGAVLVGTPHTLLQIKKEYPETFAGLREKTNLLIFDEGHYEPAQSWGDAVKMFNRPTVLLSATPYRNDLRPFPIEPQHMFAYSLHEAVGDRFLREVGFKVLPGKLNVGAFASELVSYFTNEFQTLKPSGVTEPRVIVRCETFEEVESMTQTLQELGQKTVGIHHRFTSRDHHEHCYAQVDQVPDELGAVFWVHQFKLMEGIDDENFCLLAVYSSPQNDRSIVQQIGRIIRNRRRTPNQSGYVFYAGHTGIKRAWERYLRADKALCRQISRTQPTPSTGLVNVEEDSPKRLMIDHHPTAYIHSRFRQQFDINAPDAYKCLALPHCACIYRLERGDLSPQELLDRLTENTKNEWARHNRAAVAPKDPPDHNTRVILYYAYRNSPLLLEDWYFIECTLGATVFHWFAPFLFYYDSGGIMSECIALLEQKLEPRELKRLFPYGGSRLNSIALSNTNLGRQSLRSRRLQAHSIAQTIHGIEDHMYICNSASGYVLRNEMDIIDHKKNKTDIRRNVTFRRKRVRQTSGKRLQLDQYTDWLDNIALTLMEESAPALDVFDRFAQARPAPENPRPRHILLDLFDVEDNFSCERTGQKLCVDDISAEAVPNSGIDNNTVTFEYKINGKPFNIDVTYNPRTRHYMLEQSELNGMFKHKINETLGIISYLNRHQAFRIVPEDSGTIYAYGEFYQPTLCVGKDMNKNQLELCRLLEGEKRLMGIDSEKGKQSRRDNTLWQENSLFNIIDQAPVNGAFNGLLKDIDTLICDDMGTEVADFIAVSGPKENPDPTKPPHEEKVILIHAKAFKKQQTYSASKFAEVCSQAIKNLHYVHRFANAEPPNLSQWVIPWKERETNRVYSRYRLYKNIPLPTPKPNPYEVWDYIRDIIRNPLSRLEVWIVLGNGISKSELMNKYMKEDPPKAEIIQNIYQLESTWSIVTRMGATLRIFSRP